mmetsp:Transcript_28328/g.25138  ORF Transcript_28328/g.25138 Transcript_28328/m.25138 type:complete len:439 (+) Transcript_28328:177-1493(+)
MGKLFVDVNTLYRAKGANLFERTHKCSDMLDIQKKYQLWLYFKTAVTAGHAVSKGHDVHGNYFEGPNFATQDYLSLAADESTKEEAIRTIKEFGIHSGGAALAYGTHPYYLDFQKEMADYMGVSSVIIYSAGWMAGYGVMRGLVRDYDHIVMDRLAHNCLQEGAKASTKNVYITQHLDDKAMMNKVKEIREKDKNNAIIVVSESLYSMDSDTHDLVYLQKECKKYNAYLIIDMAHDLGGVGEVGRGALETQGVTDLSNVLIVGSGSKVLSTNIGFVGCDDPKVIEYMRYFSPPYMYCNVVAPPQCAAALNNLRIIKSPKGLELRKKVMDNSIYLRDRLKKMGFKCLGSPSPIVIVIIGDELTCRLTSRFMLNNNVIVNGIEYPIVPFGQARLRLQLQAQHSKENLDTFCEKLEMCFNQAKEMKTKVQEMVKMGVQPKL